MDSEIRRLVKRTLLVTICLLMVLSPFYAAPSGVQATAQFEPRYGGTLRIAFHSDPGSFNQFYGSNYVYNLNLFAKPYRYDDRYNPVGYAMQGYPTITSEPGYPTVYTMELKHNIKWHDGVPMTAEDVKFTFETYAWGGLNRADAPDPTISDRLKQPTWNHDDFENLKKIETEGDYIVKFYFNEIQLDYWLFSGSYNFIIPKHLWKDYNRHQPSGQTFETNTYNLKPVGSGPFRLTEYVPDQHVIMERFEDYFDGVPYLERLSWKILNRNAAMLALENGEVDTVREITFYGWPLQEITRLNQDSRFTAVGFPYPTTYRITPNFHPDALAMWPWLDDVNVRKAMEYAIDKSTFCEQVLLGVTKPTSTAISWLVAPWSADYNTVDQGYSGPWAIEKRDYNPDKARQLLGDAGWTLNADEVRHKNFDGVDYTLSDVQMPCYNHLIDLAKELTKYWQAVGIFVDPVPIRSTPFYDHIEGGEFGLMDPEVGGPYPLSFNTMGGMVEHIKYWLETRSEWDSGWDSGHENFGWYSNSRVDELFEIAESTAVYSTRKEAYDELQYRVHEDAGFLMLWNNWRSEVWSNDFAGFGSNRPLDLWGGYFRGEDGSSNSEKGVYWRDGTPITTSVSTPVDTPTVPEVMDLRLLIAFGLLFCVEICMYRRRKMRY